MLEKQILTSGKTYDAAFVMASHRASNYFSSGETVYIDEEANTVMFTRICSFAK